MGAESVDKVLAEHRAAGRVFGAAGVTTFALDEGEGEPVLLLHGLPVSSFLYRRVVPRVARHGFRAIAFDFPGMGLSDRPVDFDYSIRGLAAFTYAAVDSLGVDRFHLVVHDAGGPVGFQVAGVDPSRIRSLTVLNTVTRRGPLPFPGELYARVSNRFAGPLTSPALFRQLMARVGIADVARVPPEETDAHRRLLLDADGGSSYLRIMRSLHGDTLGPWDDVIDSRRVPYPVDVLWGARDPMLTLRRHGLPILAAARLPYLKVVDAKHYLQEDQPDVVADVIVANAQRADASRGELT